MKFDLHALVVLFHVTEDQIKRYFYLRQHFLLVDS